VVPLVFNASEIDNYELRVWGGNSIPLHLQWPLWRKHIQVLIIFSKYSLKIISGSLDRYSFQSGINSMISNL
jgi:hypothetical protein